jgi:plastocyanin
MRGMMVVAAGALASFAAAQTLLAQSPAVEATVVQRDIDFDVKEVRIRAGGQVVFVNGDPFGHNVYSESAGGEFDVGRQAPNSRVSVPFRRAGSFAVKCRIHPRMAMQIVVE